MKTKTFDCVDMKRRGAKVVQEQIRHLTIEEEVQFWRAQTEALRRRQKELLEGRTHPKGP